MFYPKEAVDRHFPRYELEVAARDGRFEDEGWRVRKDGSRFWARVVITALRDEAGALTGYAKVTSDLSPRKEADDLLRRSEEQFRLLVQSVQDCAILMLDPAGRVVTWNDGAQRMKGYTAEEIVGQSFERFYPPEKVVEGFPTSELEIAARDGRFEDEDWRIRKDGSRFWANVVMTALRDGTGRLVGVAKVTRDLTARRQAEEQARQLAVALLARSVQSVRFAQTRRESGRRLPAW